MTNKTYRFAAVAAVLLALCLVFIAPVGADNLYVGSDEAYTTLAAAVDNAEPGDTIILKEGMHQGVCKAIEKKGLVIKGETGAQYILDTITGSTGPGFAISADDVVISDLTIIVKEQVTGNPVFALAANNLTIERCTVTAEKGGLYFINGAIADYKITISDTTFNNLGSDAMYTVYAGTHNAEHTKLLTFTGNTIEGKFSAGIDAITGNYVISDNIFDISGGYAIGITVHAKKSVTSETKTISKNTFEAGVINAVRIQPFSTGDDQVEMFAAEIPVISNDNVLKSNGPLLEVSLLNTVSGYHFAEIPVITPYDVIYSYGSGEKYGVIGDFDANKEIPLVPGVNLPGSSWSGDATSGYTLTFTADGTYKVMEGFAVKANGIIVSSGETITLDLNGKTISGTKNDKTAAIVVNKGELTIKDDIGNGKITSSFQNPDLDWAPEGFPTYATNTIKNEGKLTVKSGTIESKTNGGASYAIDSYQNSILTVDGGVITGSPNNVAIRVFANGGDTKVTINDGSISGKRAIWIHLPSSCYTREPAVDLTVNGGTLTSTGYVSGGVEYHDVIYSYTYGDSFENTKIAINDGIFNGDVAFSGGLSNRCADGTDEEKTLCKTCQGKCLDDVTAKALETVSVSGGTITGGIYSYGVDDSENKKQAMAPFITGGTFGENPSEYVKNTHEAVLVGGKYVVAEKGTLAPEITATDIGFDSVKVGYTQPGEKTVTLKNAGTIDLTLKEITSKNFIVGTPSSQSLIYGGSDVTFTIQPKENLPVGNYEETIKVTTVEGADTSFKVSFLVYQPSSGGSSKPVEEPEEPVEPETPEEPVAGEITTETEVSNGGEVAFETPAAPETPEAGEPSEGPAAAPAEPVVTGVVLPEGTDSKVTFIPVSDKPAPAGKEQQTKKVFEINVPTYEKGKPATVKFTMTVAELAKDGKTAADVALWHQDEETGEWTKLVISYTIIDGVVYFEAITHDFSPFAIVYEDAAVEEPTEEPTEEPASPAPILAVLAGLGAAAVLRRK